MNNPKSVQYVLIRSDTSGFIQASLIKIQGLFKDFKDYPTFFKDNKFMKNPEFSVKILLQKCRLRKWRNWY